VVDGGMLRSAERDDLKRCILRSSSQNLMWVFGPIVPPESRFMSQLSRRRRNGEQLVGYRQLRRQSLPLEKLTHQSQGGPAVAPALNQHVEDLALVVESTPEVHPLAGDPDHHLVQMPSVARPRAAPS